MNIRFRTRMKAIKRYKDPGFERYTAIANLLDKYSNYGTITKNHVKSYLHMREVASQLAKSCPFISSGKRIKTYDGLVGIKI